MKNRYRVMNAHGSVLCHKDTAQQAADVVCNLGRELCTTQFIEDLRHGSAFPYTTYYHDGFAFIGAMHGTKESAIAALSKLQPIRSTGFICGDWHAWMSNGNVLLSDESEKKLRTFNDWDSCINWLFISGYKNAARALNKHVKESA